MTEQTVRIEAGLREEVPDAAGQGIAAQARQWFGFDVRRCRCREVYRIRAELDPDRAGMVRAAFGDPVVAETALDRLPSPEGFDWLIEIGYKPGVTDNVGRTARCVLEDLIERELDWREQVFTSRQVFLWGALERGDAEHLGRDLLANPLIQDVRVFSRQEWVNSDIDRSVPVFTDRPALEVHTFDLSGDDEDLMRISREGILSMSLAEMRSVRDHYLSEPVRAHRRELGLPDWPTDVELECIAQTWSEHCFHKIFAAEVEYRDEETGEEEHIRSLFKTYIRAATEKVAERADWLVSVFSDNAGIVRFDDEVHVAYKVETHNSPSALDPYGGAMTGIVGVNRDPMGTGMGCALLTNVWGYCLGSPFFDGELPEGLMHPRRIRDGVHQGVIDGGNQSGIPWSRGFECFDERYLGKPLVYCGTVGVTPVEVAGGPAERKEVEPGDLVVMCGGRIGKDGIHGATFSSEELRMESPAQAVQIGDPLTQRKLYEFLLEARDRGLYRCITDNGAGGISCSFGEMGRLSGGCRCELADAPLKYEGLQPWEILLSEAQERMTLAVSPEHRDELLELARRRDVELAVMGAFTDDGYFTVMWRGETVASLDMDFLYESGCPRMTIPARWTTPEISAPPRPEERDLTPRLKRVLADLNQCSREYKSRMYDGEVKGLSVVKPFMGVCADTPSDATVLRVRYDSDRGIVLSEGIHPWLSDLDTYAMTVSVVDEAVRRAVAAGARPDRIALLDNFCWPDPVESEKTPDGAYKMAQLVRSNRALYDLCTAWGTPLISGKDSMKNDSTRGGRKISIPPTLLISALGQIDDVRTAVTTPFKRAGDAIFVAGVTMDETGASAWARSLAADAGSPLACGGRAPGVDPASAWRRFEAVHRAAESGLLRSATTPARGGLALALVMGCLGGACGADLELGALPVEGELDDAVRLFSETNSRFVLTCAPEDEEALKDRFAGTPFARIGTVRGHGRLTVRGHDGEAVMDADVEDLRATFKGTLEGV
ncbi:AIR synthase-related protein [Kiritimatiella glycovorans]|uniref:Phosphoribosylformylglycinamidine synthase subunit PurL n=1 Tax=Kiritimatiella glycovorans TaxID=1307763 RepID=A0A0G3EJU3_9BACT|nr:AIR synthase-related protein [Kiritimatiella glycovorans]AKJ65060.1 Phosphoribosylformylglycinamidine synthase 2 [Kiritimatiella glycovorans]